MRIKVNRELNNIIAAAFAEAKKRTHEYITPEHILYASLFFSSGSDIIFNCGGDIERIKDDLEDFFEQDYVPTTQNREPVESEGFHNVIQNAMLHVASCGKDVLDIGDIFASLFLEQDSFAVAFLEKDDISRLSILEYITHGISVVPDGGVPEYEDEDMEDMEGPEDGEDDDSHDEDDETVEAEPATRRSRSKKKKRNTWNSTPPN